MSELLPVTNSGLISLSGFAYQMKVFLLFLSKLQEGQQVEFETLDDIAINDVQNNDKIGDFCVKRTRTNDGNITAIQVKQAAVTESVGRKVLYNWLLAYSAQPAIGKFLLCVEEGYSISEKAFKNRAQKEYQTIVKSNCLPTALVTRVKEIYCDNYDKFEKDYNFVCEHREIKKMQVEQELTAILVREFHATANTVGPLFFDYRIKELFNIICSRIIDCALKRSPYICTHSEFEQVCEEICRRISQDNFEPDYQAFSRNLEPIIQNTELMDCREYRQLEHCGLSISQIIDHIGWKQYYSNIRQHYLSDARGEKIASTENIAYQNHQNVILELQAEDRDKPLLRLLKTKQQTISTLSSEFSRWGAYVYLTKADVTCQISWKDDNYEKDEQ